MPQPRKLDETMLLFWDAQGVTTVEMQRRLAESGTTASVDLIRLRLREARRDARGEPPAPKPQRKSSATNRRQTQIAEALALVQALKEDLEGTLAGWGDAFGGSDRHERFTTAVADLEAIAGSLDGIDVSWNG